jgi:hypothetical protein
MAVVINEVAPIGKDDAFPIKVLGRLNPLAVQRLTCLNLPTNRLAEQAIF